MNYEDVVAGLRSLQEHDFDDANVDARGIERLRELTDALRKIDRAKEAMVELFAVMERMPTAELGSPGPLVHLLESLSGYEPELVESIRRRPSQLTLWMLNRVLNTDLPSAKRRAYLALMEEASLHPRAEEIVRTSALDFLKYQE